MRTTGRLLNVALGIAYGLLAPLTARAEQSPELDEVLALKWNAPEGCPDSSKISNKVRSLLDGGKALAVDTKLNVDARAEQASPQDWLLTMTWQRANAPASTRSVSAKSCDELADAAALLIAFALDQELGDSPTSAVANATDSPANPIEPKQAVSNKKPRVVPKPPPRRSVAAVTPSKAGHAEGSEIASSRQGVHFHLGAGPALVTGWLPQASTGLVLLGDASVGGWALGLELAGYAPVRANNAAETAAGEFWLGSGAVTLAYSVDLAGLLQIAPLVGAELNLIDGSGKGLAKAREGATSAGAWIGGGRLSYELAGRWKLFAGAQVSVADVRPTFTVGNGGGTVFRPAAVGFRAGLGLEVQLR